MPGPLKFPKYEKFAQLIASGKTRTEAALEMGYAKARAGNTGSDLARRPDIAARVQELKVSGNAAALKMVALSRKYVLDELMINVQLARQEHQIPASNRALELLGNEIGMFSTKTTNIDIDIASITS